MKFRLPAAAAVLFCCMSCVDIDSEIGGNLIPLNQTYNIFPKEVTIPADVLYNKMADSLSGFSQTRITIGSIRDAEYGLTRRACAVTLIPVKDTLDCGNPKAVKVLGFHFAADFDTLSCSMLNQEKILQEVEVFSLNKPTDPYFHYDSNGKPDVDFGKSIVKGSPIINGADSLSFDFTEEYAKRFLDLTVEDLSSYENYVKKIPGIYIRTADPNGFGGRINMFRLQLGFDSDYYSVTGNYAELKLKCDYDMDGKPETDTSFFFLFGLSDKMSVDSLLENGTVGSYPEYCLNLTEQSTRPLTGKAKETLFIEGGGGLKPVISATGLKHLAEQMITAEGGDPKSAVINKASLVFPFEFPADYKQMFKFPVRLNPVCRMRYSAAGPGPDGQTDTVSIVYASLTDASSEDENQGDINRSTLRYEPDITYHIQELLKINETPVAGESSASVTKRNMLLGGQYDIWLLNMANEVEQEESSSSSSDLSDYYQYLAYQSYYNQMYGGYGGYSSYGYGGYGGYGYDSYSNYYSYMLAAQYASSSTSTVSYTLQLDKDRYYCSALNGPEYSDPALRPVFKLTFSLMKTK